MGQTFDLERRELSELFFGAVLQDLRMIGLVEEACENPVPVLSSEKRETVEDHPIRSAASGEEIPWSQFGPTPAAGFLTLLHEIFRQTKLEDPIADRGPILPFTERFYKARRKTSVTG